MPRNKTNVKFPRKARFTIADCIALNANLNAQTVRTLVRDAIAAREVTVVGHVESTGRGRPAFLLALS